MFYEKQESDYGNKPFNQILQEARGIWSDRPEGTLILARKLRQQAENRHT